MTLKDSIYATPSTSIYDQQPAQVAEPVSLDFNILVVKPVETMLAQVVGFIPDLLAGIYILVFGWLIARVLKFLFTKFLNAVRFDVISDKIGISAMLNEGGGKKITASAWFGTLAFWITFFISVIMALDRLRLHIASSRLDQMMHLFISVITMIIILTLGLFLSVIASRIIRSSGEYLKIKSTNLFANIIQGIILVLTLVLILSQFLVPGQFVLIAFGVVFVTACITFIVAFGFGGRQWAGKVLDKWY